MKNEKLLTEILNSREERYNKQKVILNDYPYSLISFNLNIPGEKKDSPLYRKAHEVGVEAIVSTLNDEQLTINSKEILNKPTGTEGYFSVDTDPMLLKKLMVKLEDNHPLGRLFDIDVFDKDHNQISRSHMEIQKRKCLICHKEAVICMREKNHNYSELIDMVKQICDNYFISRCKNGG